MLCATFYCALDNYTPNRAGSAMSTGKEGRLTKTIMLARLAVGKLSAMDSPIISSHIFICVCTCMSVAA